MSRLVTSIVAALAVAAPSIAQVHDPAQQPFYDALAQQQRADDAQAPEAERRKSREAAIASYERYLKTNPKSAGTLNNLAQLYAQDPAQRQRALELYDRAIATGDPRSSAYRLNRAKLLAEMGYGDRALQAGLDLAKADLRNDDAQAFASSLLEKGGNPHQIAAHVRSLHDAGRVVRAIETGADALDRTSAKREPILIAIAESLASPTLIELPAEFSAGDIARRLARHADAADVGPGVRELLGLYEKPADPRSLRWWRQDFHEHEELAPKTRAAALLGLARALGDRCRRAGSKHYACAEGYYQFAIDFTGATADPQAFLSLAQIYMNTERPEKLGEISERYERALFRGKNTAYGRENKPKIVQFHLALGTMYAYQEKWDDPGHTPANAIFQLEHARSVARDYNRGGPAGERLQFPVEAAELLSDAYVKTNRSADSTRLRVEVAEDLLAAGDKRGAADVVNPQWEARLPANTEPAMRDRVSRLKVATKL